MAISATLIAAGVFTASAPVATATAAPAGTVNAQLAPLKKAAPITVANFNVCAEHCVKGSSRLRYSWNFRAPKIAGQVRSVGADIVGIQEAGPSAKSWRKLASAMRAKGYAQGANRTGRGLFYRSASFVTVDEKGRNLGGKGFRVKSTRSGAKSRGGSIQVLRHRATGHRVIAVAVHLSALDGTKYDAYRLDEIRKVRALVSPYKAKHPDAAVIFVGDFNSLNHSNTRFESDTARWRVNAQMASYGFTDAYTAASYRNAASKASTLVKQPGDRRKFPPAFQLDRIYVDDMATVQNLKVANARPGGYKNQWSDHRMLYARIIINS